MISSFPEVSILGKIERQLIQMEGYLRDSPKMSLLDARTLLDVSDSTARRLFVRLEERGSAIRVHGGVQSIPKSRPEYSYPCMESRRLAQKKRIARAAIDLIGPSRIIFLDSGSTVYQLSLCIADWLRAGRRETIRLFTNSVKNLQALSGLAEIQFIGGKYREHRQDCCGFLAEEALKELNFDLCFLGADGCDIDQGVSCTDMETARLGSLAVDRSRRRIVLMDSEKFRAGALFTYAPMEKLDAVISDTELSPALESRLREKGVEAHLK